MLLPLGLSDQPPPAQRRTSLGLAAILLVGALFVPAPESDPAKLPGWGAFVSHMASHPALPVPKDCLHMLTARGDVGAAANAEDAKVARQRCDALQSELNATGWRSLSFIPRKGLMQYGILTYMWVNGRLVPALLHVLFLALLVGPPLESLWGPRPLVGVFVGGAIMGALVAGLVSPESASPVVGASMAVSACVGGFLWRFREAPIAYAIWLPSGKTEKTAPAWIYGALWLGLVTVTSLGGDAGVFAGLIASVGSGAVGAIAMESAGWIPPRKAKGAAPLDAEQTLRASPLSEGWRDVAGTPRPLNESAPQPANPTAAPPASTDGQQVPAQPVPETSADRHADSGLHRARLAAFSWDESETESRDGSPERPANANSNNNDHLGAPSDEREAAGGDGFDPASDLDFAPATRPNLVLADTRATQPKPEATTDTSSGVEAAKDASNPKNQDMRSIRAAQLPATDDANKESPVMSSSPDEATDIDEQALTQALDSGAAARARRELDAKLLRATPAEIAPTVTLSPDQVHDVSISRRVDGGYGVHIAGGGESVLLWRAIRSVAVGLVPAGEQRRALMTLVLLERNGRSELWRIPLANINLSALGAPTAKRSEIWRALIEEMVRRSGASTLPAETHWPGPPYPAFADLKTLEKLIQTQLN
ncbi:MAG: rhomboid family intramembrane serine protease [Myxococcales bacterium]|nr:rhomboid family intramembrane serine protease [Myxococcales bacterium]